jgi:putative tricarboxylic transport membrane protein
MKEEMPMLDRLAESGTHRWRLSAAMLALAVGLMAGSPAKAIDELTIIAPANPGGGWDQTARSMQEALQAASVVPTVTVENIGGAGGTIGLAQFVDTRKGDGNSMLVGGLVVVGAILTNQAPVTLEQVTPLARLTGEYEVIVVPAASELKSLDDLVAKLKADPGSVAWAGGSAGGTDHILVGLIAQAAGADPAMINYVPFSGGGEALAALLGNHVAAGVSGYGEWAGQIESGELRALAISSPERVEGLDIPTLKEQGINVELANWRGVVAPPELDDAERQALLDAVDAMVKSDSWRNILTQKGWMDLYMPGDEFGTYLKSENERITAILKQIGLVQ